MALKSFTDNEVMASGKDPDNVLKKAADRGAEDPVIVFVPETDANIFAPII